jgi:hypothetical protein
VRTQEDIKCSGDTRTAPASAAASNARAAVRCRKDKGDGPHATDHRLPISRKFSSASAASAAAAVSNAIRPGAKAIAGRLKPPPSSTARISAV